MLGSGSFLVVLVAAFDRLARSTRHFLQVIDELDGLQIEFISRRENIDTSGPMGRLFLTLISSIAELELDLIRERVRAGMRRARLEGRQIGRARLDVDHTALAADRRDGMSLSRIATKHGISKASVCRLLKECHEMPVKALPSIEDLGLRLGFDGPRRAHGTAAPIRPPADQCWHACLEQHRHAQTRHPGRTGNRGCNGRVQSSG